MPATQIYGHTGLLQCLATLENVAHTTPGAVEFCRDQDHSTYFFSH